MKRWWLASVLAGGALFSSAISAAAQGPIRSETRVVGVYTVRIDFYSDPAFTGKRLSFDVVVSAIPVDQLRGLTLSVTAIPDVGTNASALRATVSAAHSVGGFQGNVTMQVRGSYRLLLTIGGAAGSNTVDLPLNVAAPTAIPIWLAWAVGLSPLAVLMGFGVSQRSYLARLQEGAFLGPPAASTPPGT